MPHASDLAARLGLERSLASPATGAAFVWHGRLHPIPDGLALGLPGRVLPLVTSRLLSVRGIARAAAEPLLPRRPDGDSVGRLVRSRFGTEVHERLVDPLVGSIYATDTDRFSLAMVPQLATLARRRSLLLAARAADTGGGDRAGVRRTGGGHAAAGDAGRRGARPPAPPWSAAARCTRAADGAGWRVDDEPGRRRGARHARRRRGRSSSGGRPRPGRAAGGDRIRRRRDRTLAVDAADWPARLAGRSGYLVPKPRPALVTAASFGSQKWAHWRAGDGS